MITSLLAWGESIKPIAQLAFKGEGELTAGDHCQFCKVRHTCRARADAALKTVGDMSKGAELTNEELAALYPKLDGVVRWANDLSDYCLSKAEAGTKFAGLKLVAGRSTRKFIDNEEKVIAKFSELGIDEDDYLTKKLVGITAAETLVGKKEFAQEFADLVIKPEGKPTLVSATDKRPEISDHSAALKELLS